MVIVNLSNTFTFVKQKSYDSPIDILPALIHEQIGSSQQNFDFRD